jgi:hypothetical protein
VIRVSTLILLAAVTAHPLFARDKQQRIHLSAFKVLMDDSEMEARSHLDIGVEESSASGVRRCEILSPKNTKPYEKLWEPLDFYTQVKPEQVDEFKDLIGRPDFFFKGDDHNRNSAQDPHKLTRQLAGSLKASLDFLQKSISPAKDWVEVVVSFRRGPLKFDGLMRAKAFEVSNGCDATLEYCTKATTVGGKKVCDANGWTHQIREVSAKADVAGYLDDRRIEFLYRKPINDQDRKDVHSLIAMVIPVGEDPTTTTPTELVWASK